jgi:hypothetical protein
MLSNDEIIELRSMLLDRGAVAPLSVHDQNLYRDCDIALGIVRCKPETREEARARLSRQLQQPAPFTQCPACDDATAAKSVLLAKALDKALDEARRRYQGEINSMRAVIDAVERWTDDESGDVRDEVVFAAINAYRACKEGPVKFSKRPGNPLASALRALALFVEGAPGAPTEVRDDLAIWLNTKLDEMYGAEGFGTEAPSDPRGGGATAERAP